MDEYTADEIAKQNMQCREIVKEITDFGVNQRQIYFLMYLLSLNLENLKNMRELSSILRVIEEKTHIIDPEEDDGDKLTT